MTLTHPSIIGSIPLPTPEVRYGTLQEAADHYRVSTKTIRARIADGSIRGFRFGPKLLRVELISFEKLALGGDSK